MELLELPGDYDWVVQSGSKNGYHIIFFAEEHGFIKDPKRTVAYGPNKKNEDKFKHIEMRWIGHLVLPPSIHSSYYSYQFRNNLFPLRAPEKVNIEQISNMLEASCSGLVNWGAYGSYSFILAEEPGKLNYTEKRIYAFLCNPGEYWL